MSRIAAISMPDDRPNEGLGAGLMTSRAAARMDF
jgi:hypothetical protein